MVGSQYRLRQIAELEREIDGLLEERDALDLTLHSPSLELGHLKRIHLWLIIRGLCQRLERLKMTRNMAYNGYLQLLRDETRRS